MDKITDNLIKDLLKLEIVGNQIVIKINKEKFMPVLDHLIERGSSVSYSEAVAKCISFCYYFANSEYPEKLGVTHQDLIIQAGKTYNLIRRGKLVPKKTGTQ